MSGSHGVKCPKCGAANAPDVLSCTECDEQLYWETCPLCDQPAASPTSRFCEHCGAWLATGPQITYPPAAAGPEPEAAESETPADDGPAPAPGAVRTEPQAPAAARVTAEVRVQGPPATVRLELYDDEPPPQPDRACPECGAAVGPGLRNCARCGAAVPLMSAPRAGGYGRAHAQSWGGEPNAAIWNAPTRSQAPGGQPRGQARGPAATDTRQAGRPRQGSAWGTPVAVIALVVAALLMIRVPVVRARVPVVGPIARAVDQVLDRSLAWVQDLLPGPDTAAKSPAPEAVLPSAKAPDPEAEASVQDPGMPPAAPTAGARDASRPQPQPARRTAARARKTTRPAPRAGRATLTVFSMPGGVEVGVAGRRGVTPLTVQGLAPGTYTIRLSKAGYKPVTRTLRVGAGRATVIIQMERGTAAGPEKPAPRSPATVRPGAPAQDRRSFDPGAPAPDFSLKDRLGLLYRPHDMLGRRGMILFVWSLDARSRSFITTLDRRVRASGTRAPVWVVVLRPDRVAMRAFIDSAEITLPVLFGNGQVAAAYGVPRGVPAAVYIAENGAIARRQVGSVSLSPP